MPRTTRSAAAKAAATVAKLPQQLSSPPVTPAPSSRKRTRKSIKQEDFDVNELPHNLGTALPTPGADDDADPAVSPPTKRAKRAPVSRTSRNVKAESDHSEIKAEDELKPEIPSAKKKTPKKAQYGLTPGVSPYPDYSRPTPEECHEVVRILSKAHGNVVAPKSIPPPSLNYSGCGEVPSVLDALVRTRLSANTTNQNSSTAFQGLVKRFGTLKEGVGKGSVDWDAVRRAPNSEVFKAIERGGLANIKSRDIQAILQMAYDENQARKADLTDPSRPDPPGAAHETPAEQRAEVARATSAVISLDHIHALSTPAAIAKMVEYPGIGVKTASCVALFCLQRPSFAVDTHVFRLCTYLGWVPPRPAPGQPKVDRDTCFSHCEIRVPDPLKYPLHQLLIKHGKICPRCRAATGTSSADWHAGCPIEHLVRRHGAKKGGISAVDRKKAAAAAAAAAAIQSDEQGAGESELSDVPDEDDVEAEE